MATVPDEKDVRLTDREFGEARTPPGWIFHDPALYERELEEIFRSMWLVACHHTRLAAPGDFLVVDVGPESVILVRDKAGRARAFHNVCRHRGTRVVTEGSGHCRMFRCPYHNWAYGLDGELIAAPTMEEVPGFDRRHYPLREVRLESMQGFLFINLDEDAQPLREAFSDFPALSRYAAQTLQPAGRHEYEVAANWKLVCENYNECYHCSLAHPQLHRVTTYEAFPEHDVTGRNFNGGPMGIKDGCNTLTVSGVTENPPLPGLDEQEKRLVHYFNVYPNFLYSLAPDYVMAHYLWPRGPGSVYIETEWFCSPEQMADPAFDPQDAIDFWDMTNRQDWSLCENAQLGLASSGHVPGPYHPSESGVHAFDQWYVRRMFGDPPR
ncbi:MAG: aromatic ring-hydroxylating dioxygenase subunit alpha [Gammaproteobacteria bacterium]